METATTHEARARNAKAQVFAALLHEHKFGRLNRPGTLLEAVRAITAEHWSTMAELATLRNMLGAGVTVHVPHSRATIDAVARILGDLIAHEADQAAIAEQVAPQTDSQGPPRFPSTTDPDAVERGYHQRVENMEPVRRPTDSQGYRATVGQLDPETARTFAAFAQADRR